MWPKKRSESISIVDEPNRFFSQGAARLTYSCLFFDQWGQWLTTAQWAVGSGQWAVGSGQGEVGSRQWEWAMGSGEWAMGSGEWAMESGE